MPHRSARSASAARPRRGFLRDDAGAITLLMLLLIPGILLIGGLATDISQINAQKRYVQAQADLAAQSAAHYLRDTDAARAVARAVVLANDRFGAVELADADIEFGTVTREDGFVPAADQSAPGAADAVRVTVPSPFRPILLRPFFQGEDRLIRRWAVGTAGPATVAFTLRNRLLNLDTGASVLNGVLNAALGTSLNLDAVGYQGLANTHVSIDELLGLLSLHAAADAVSFDEVLNLPVAVPNLLGGLVDLGVLPPSAAPPGGGGAHITPADMLALSPRLLHLFAGDVLPNIGLNAFDLLMAIAGLANDDPGARVGISTGLDVSPLASVALEVGLIRPPVTVVGTPGDDPPLRAEVPQADVSIAANAAGLIRLRLDVSAAAAEAVLTELNCAASEPSDVVAVFEVATAPATVRLNVGLLDTRPNVDDRISLPIPVGGGAPQTITVTKAQYDARTPVPIPNEITVSGVVNSLQSLLGSIRGDLQTRRNQCTGLLAPILCVLVGLVTGGLVAIVQLLDGLLGAVGNLIADIGLLNTIVQTLLDLLGIRLAQAELILEDYDCLGSARLAL